ncbi:MAG: PEP-CTERM sorting domain-containing protein [Burkholderiaceae bacterium]|nr:PEP-CTERM sorting domain-containing protein [Rhodoferax sp.]MCP5286819.1 PEP-CTERM sorting domain-containing protein [Burkholderiaceae bacterium]
MTPTPISPTLRQRAERVLAASALGALAGTSIATQAAALTTTDFVVEGSGAYFYNSSGYFADWQGRPDGQPVNEVNPDGSAKLYGDVSASSSQLLSHNCNTEYGCSWYEDRGVTLVWWGTLRQPAQEGDRISMAYDFNITMPDTGGVWTLRASLGSWDFGQSNSLNSSGSYLEGGLEEGSHHLQGVYETQALEPWDLSPDSPVMYWQVSLSAYAYAPWDETYWSDTYNDYVTPFRGLSISVPNQSLDITLLGNVTQPVPEPGTLALALTGLAGVLARRRQQVA